MRKKNKKITEKIKIKNQQKLKQQHVFRVRKCMKESQVMVEECTEFIVEYH